MNCFLAVIVVCNLSTVLTVFLSFTFLFGLGSEGLVIFHCEKGMWKIYKAVNFFLIGGSSAFSVSLGAFKCP